MPLTTEQDALGTDRYVKGLKNFISNSTTPITIALQGEWGSGKTSLMNRLQNELCSVDGDFIGVTVNTWEYSMLSSSEETVLKILSQLVRTLTNEDPQSQKTFSDFFRGAGNFLYRGARESLKTIPGVGGLFAVGLEAANVPTQILSSSDDNQMASLADLKTALEDAIRRRIEEEKKVGVIIFIDDLDRLNPPVAVEILELLKNIFTLPNCIFMLAIDYDVVVKGLKPKFGELTDKNEREFRSFFDKIIQVPFSLPVSSYHPENFLLEQLRSVGYLSDSDMNSRDKVKNALTTIVNKTVGKNPRAIKRLINSLSLINCIANECETTVDTPLSPQSIDGKIVNFAIIAMQISYPQIYKMFIAEPDFRKWDVEFAKRFVTAIDGETGVDDVAGCEDVLGIICSSDTYLKRHEGDIEDILRMICELADGEHNGEDIGSVLKVFIDRSSVTEVGQGGKHTESLDYAEIVMALHDNVTAELNRRHKEWKVTCRRVTNCGGFNIFPIGKHFQTKLSPKELNNGRISMSLYVPLEVNIIYFPNIKRLLDLGHADAIKDQRFSDMVDMMDNVIKPLIGKEWFLGELVRTRYQNVWHKKGNWLNPKRVLFDMEFVFTVPYASGFEGEEIWTAIADIHEALWHMYEKAKTL